MKDMNPFGEPLPESDVSKKESAYEFWDKKENEDLWNEVYKLCQRGPASPIPELMKKFTITRKP